MTIIAIINRKGGCGKSTLASHLAVWLSRQGQRVMLADVDYQQSIVSWLQRRRAQDVEGEIHGWVTDARNVLRPPIGIMHSVMDTPGGIHGFELARLLVFADVVLMPICDSAFDYESAAACLAEMRAHPRVANGRVRIAAVGMRVHPRTSADQRVRAWAADHDIEFLGSIRASQVYVRCAASGLTVFDLPPAGAAVDLAPWGPVVEWLDAALEGGKVISQARKARLSPAEPFERRVVDSTSDLRLTAAQPSLGSPSDILHRMPGGTGRAVPQAPFGIVRRVLRLLPSWNSQERLPRGT